jgi:hypothetical protein
MLRKACNDSFQYALQLRDGTVFEFEEADPIDDEWVRISGISMAPNTFHKFTFARGLDVRVSEIVWVADAPHGS